MATKVKKLGPTDHGLRLTLEEFLSGDYVGGYHYELIYGRLYVAALPNLPAGWVEHWLYRLLDRYSEQHPQAINFVYNKTRVFVPGEEEVTAPEPDVAAYRDFPLDRPLGEVDWRDVSPVLVVEVVTESDPAKDRIRNVRLYRQVPSIREYWILDQRESAEQPSLLVYRRIGRGWRTIDVAPGGTYTTPLLPGFTLTLNTRS